MESVLALSLVLLITVRDAVGIAKRSSFAARLCRALCAQFVRGRSHVQLAVDRCPLQALRHCFWISDSCSDRGRLATGGVNLKHCLQAPAPLLHLQACTSRAAMSLARQGSWMKCPVTLEPFSTDTASDAVPVVLACGHTLSHGAVRRVRRSLRVFCSGDRSTRSRRAQGRVLGRPHRARCKLGLAQSLYIRSVSSAEFVRKHTLACHPPTPEC